MTVTNEPVRLAGGVFDRSLGHALLTLVEEVLTLQERSPQA